MFHNQDHFILSMLLNLMLFLNSMYTFEAKVVILPIGSRALASSDSLRRLKLCFAVSLHVVKYFQTINCTSIK